MAVQGNGDRPARTHPAPHHWNPSNFTEVIEKNYSALPPTLPLEDDILRLFHWCRPDLWNRAGGDAQQNQQQQQQQQQVQHSGRQEEDPTLSPLVCHLATTRNALLEKIQYPCLASYAFLTPGIIYQTCFPEAVKILSAPKRESDGFEPRFLDLGCGLAQDVRAMMAFSTPENNQTSAVPSHRLVGADLERPLIDGGFRLFGDESGKGKVAGVEWQTTDVFRQDDLQRLKDLTWRGEGFDVIWLGSFIHLFSLGAQRRVVSALEFLLSKRPGSILFGRQTGCPDGQAYAKSGSRRRSHYEQGDKEDDGDDSTSTYRHDASTFRAMFEAKNNSAAPWECEVLTLDTAKAAAGKDPKRNAEATKEAEAKNAQVLDTREEMGRGGQKVQIKSLHFVVRRSGTA